MAQITLEELYTGEGRGEKYGGLMSEVLTDAMLQRIPKHCEPQTWIELLLVKHTLLLAERLKQEGDFVSGVTDAKPLSQSTREETT